MLETAARFEGFENFIENMFGPDGYFPDDRLMQLLKIKPTGANGRGRRSAAEDEMNEIKSNLEKLQDKVGNSVYVIRTLPDKCTLHTSTEIVYASQVTVRLKSQACG